MIAYQYNRSTGFYVGITECDPDPLQPGSFILPGSAVFVPPPEAPAGKRQRWVNGQWILDDAPVDVAPAAPLTQDEILERERDTMRPYAKAFFDALELFPSPGYLHMLDRYTQTVEAVRVANKYADIVRWDQRVTIVMRSHPDIETFRESFGIPPPLLDLIFRTAVFLDNGVPKASAQVYVTAGLAALAGGAP